MITQGVELICISQLLGHENSNITLKVYAHQLESLKEKSNDKCKKIFEKFGAGITKTPVYRGFLDYFMLVAGIEPATSSLPWMRSTD